MVTRYLYLFGNVILWEKKNNPIVHLYHPSYCLSIRQSVRPSVCPSFRPAYNKVQYLKCNI